jgi:hypothetical protein
MSWDHRYYEATCRQCGAKGFKIYSADDWNRSEISWKGFTPFRDFPRYEYLVKRKKKLMRISMLSVRVGVPISK